MPDPNEQRYLGVINSNATPNLGLPKTSYKLLHDGRVLRFFLPVGSVAGITNRNNVLYPWECLSDQKGWKWPFVLERIMSNTLYCQVGHPDVPRLADPVVFKKNQELERRAARGDKAAIAKLEAEKIKVVNKILTLDMENSNSRILRFIDNKPCLSAIIETLVNPAGKTLRDQILYNNLIPGYSLRALTNLEPDRQRRCLVATVPTCVATLDIVTSPAVPDARPPNANTVGLNLTDMVDRIPMPSLDSVVSGFADYVETTIEKTERGKAAAETLSECFGKKPIYTVCDSGDIALVGSGDDASTERIMLFMDRQNGLSEKYQRASRDVKQELMTSFWK